MENKLYIDYEELYNDGDTLIKESININTNVEAVTNMLDKSIEESWFGDDSKAYINQLKKVCVSLSKYSEEINNIGTYLQDVSIDYQTAKDNCIKELKNNE